MYTCILNKDIGLHRALANIAKSNHLMHNIMADNNEIPSLGTPTFSIEAK